MRDPEISDENIDPSKRRETPTEQYPGRGEVHTHALYDNAYHWLDGE